MKLLYWENTLIEHPMSMFVEITAKKHKVKQKCRGKWKLKSAVAQRKVSKKCPISHRQGDGDGGLGAINETA